MAKYVIQGMVGNCERECCRILHGGVRNSRYGGLNEVIVNESVAGFFMDEYVIQDTAG